MNGFSYNEGEKKISITDGKSTIIWENVEKNVADEAAKMYGEAKSIDDYLHQHECNRSWGEK